ncbi:MAG: hypothetical protein LBQ96_06365 [Fusobacteriaceae bacterium]|jgi:phage host-nuclease inhibitor protein Gam|nr:hypothetical protein [Fusobacteriaceae bacterium]
MTNTLADRLESLCYKIAEYEIEREKTIESNVEKVKLEHENDLRLIRKNIEELRGKNLSDYKKMEQMQIKLDVNDLQTELQLKELELEDILERAEEEYLRQISTHKEELELFQRDILEEAGLCGLYAEGAVKGNREDMVNGVPLETVIDALDSDWKSLRDRYWEIIGTQRSNIKRFSQRLEELNIQKGEAVAELEKSENEKNFLQGKIGLDIIDNESVSLVDGGLKRIDAAKRNILRIEREIKKTNIQRESCKEKIDIIKTMIDEVIGEMVLEYFQLNRQEIPEFLSNTKYFGQGTGNGAIKAAANTPGK